MSDAPPSRPPALGSLSVFELDLELTDSRTELINKVRWLIRARYLVSAGVVLLMLFTGWQGLTRQPALTRTSLLAILITGGVAALLNLVYFVQLRRQRNLRAFVLLQLAVDVIIFSSYVYRSGGVTSPFTFLYLLPIIAAAILVSGRATLTIALLASASYCALAIVGALGLVDHISFFVALDSFARKWSYVLLMMLVNPAAFLTVAAISVALMRAVRAKTTELESATHLLDRRAQLLDMLYRVSRSAVDARSSAAVIDQVGRLLVEGLDLDRVLLYVVAEDGDRLILVREFYHPRLADKVDRSHLQVEIPLRPEAGLTARCALDRRPENVRDPTTHPFINQELAQRIGVNPFAVAPMVFRGQLRGVLGVDRKFEAGVIDDEAFQVLCAFADQAAAALHVATLERSDR